LRNRNKLDAIPPTPTNRFFETTLENPAFVLQTSDIPRDRGQLPSFARPSNISRAHAACVPDAIVFCRAAGLQRAARRGNRNADRTPIPGIRPACRPSAISATIPHRPKPWRGRAGHGRASRRADAPRPQFGILSASLPLQTPLRQARPQSHQAHEQLPQQHGHRRHAGHTMQFGHLDGETLGSCEGGSCHVA